MVVVPEPAVKGSGALILPPFETPGVGPEQRRHQRRRWLPVAKGKQAPAALQLARSETRAGGEARHAFVLARVLDRAPTP